MIENSRTETQRRTSSEGACIGRTSELASLTDAIELLAAGIGGVVLVEGPAGIGKSFLVEHACREATLRGVASMSGGAGILERDRAFGAVFSAVGCNPQATEPRRNALWKRVAEAGMAAPWEREVSIIRFAVQDALVDLIEDELRSGPLLLAVDDLHWADAASLAALGAIAQLARHLPLQLVLSYRPVPRSEALVDLIASLQPGANRMLLGPLSAEDSAALVASRGAGGRIPFPIERLGGNPFLLLSAIDTAAQGHRADRTSADARWAVLGRLEGLGSTTIDLLRVAAALARPFDLDDLVVISGYTDLVVLQALDEASRAGVLVASGHHLAFTHDLVRETMLAELSEPLLRGLHRGIWRAMATSGRPAFGFAAYVVMAAAPGDTDAVAVLRRAGTELAETDPSSAAAFLAHAADLAAPMSWAERGEIAIDRAEVLRLAGRPAGVVSLVEECLDWPLSAEQLARLEYIGAGALRFLGRVPEALVMLRRAINRDALSPALTAWAWSLVVGGEVFSLVADDQLDDAVAEGKRIAQLSGDRTAIVQTECAASSAAWGRGRVGAALHHADIATQAAVALGNTVWPAPALFRSLALLADGQPVGAIETITPWGRRAEQAGDLWALSRMEMLTGLARFELGEWDAVGAHCETIVRIGVETGGANCQPLAQAITGLVACRRGDLDGARLQSAEGHRVAASPLFDPYGLPQLAWLDAEIAEASGDLSGARSTLDAILDITGVAAPIALLWITPSVVRVAAEMGDVARLQHVADLVSTALSGSRRGDLLAVACSAAATDGTATLEELAAGAVLDGSAYLGRDLLLTAAALHRHRSRSGDAARCLDQVDRIESALGMPAAQRRRVATVQRASTARPTFGPDSLTPAEDAVLRLVTEGLTNSMIAQRLCLSKRTVESHVSRMYLKLGVATRVELARFGLTR